MTNSPRFSALSMGLWCQSPAAMICRIAEALRASFTMAAALLTVGGLLMALAVPALQAHEASKHQFALVPFSRPFPAPDFALTDPQGKLHRLQDYRGQHVLLNFWATWCPPCLAEMPSMERLQNKFKDRKFTILAVSSDAEGAAKVTPFLNKLGITFVVLLDADGAVSKKYGARDLPSTFLLNPAGEVMAAAKGERNWSEAGAISYFDELLN